MKKPLNNHSVVDGEDRDLTQYRNGDKMTEENEKKYQIQFIGFITALGTSAMQQMGKIINPITGKIEKSLEGARATIDMLEMLQAKTEGNLSEQEKEALQNWLTNLRLNYVDEVKAEKEEEAKAESEPAASTAKEDTGGDEEPKEEAVENKNE